MTSSSPGVPATTERCGWLLSASDGSTVPCTAKRAHRIHRNDAARLRWSETYDRAIPPTAEVSS